MSTTEEDNMRKLVQSVHDHTVSKPEGDPNICVCGHPLDVHQEGSCTVHYEGSENECDCYQFKSCRLFDHPLACRHYGATSTHIKGTGPKAEVAIICCRCDRRWFGVLCVGPDLDVLQQAKDALIEGRDDEAWAIMSMAFETP